MRYAETRPALPPDRTHELGASNPSNAVLRQSVCRSRQTPDDCREPRNERINCMALVLKLLRANFRDRDWQRGQGYQRTLRVRWRVRWRIGGLVFPAGHGYNETCPRNPSG